MQNMQTGIAHDECYYMYEYEHIATGSTSHFLGFSLLVNGCCSSGDVLYFRAWRLDAGPSAKYT